MILKFQTRRLQEIPFSKELTDNYCALGLLFESITCNNNNIVDVIRKCHVAVDQDTKISNTIDWPDVSTTDCHIEFITVLQSATRA